MGTGFPCDKREAFARRSCSNRKIESFFSRGHKNAFCFDGTIDPCFIRRRASDPAHPSGQGHVDQGTNDSCLENQVKDATNKALTVGQLQTYCDCYAKAFADIMSVEDLDKNKDGLTPEVTKKAGEFSQKCAASSLKK